MTETVLPEGLSGSALLRVQGSSKLAFGATTAALVTLASGGTALLVSHGTASLSSPTALPGGLFLPDRGSTAGSGAVVVERAPGTMDAAPVVAPVDPTEQALLDALAERPKPGRRILTAPLVDLVDLVDRVDGTTTTPVVGAPPVTPPVLPPPDVTPPDVTPPVVTPPVITPPVVTPPVISPPVVTPPVITPPVIRLPDLPRKPVASGSVLPGKADRETRRDRALTQDRDDKQEREGKGRHSRGRHSR